MFLDRRLIIFDLDGTLIDSLGIWSEVDVRLVEELSKDHVRLTPEETYALRIGSLSRYGEGSEAYFKYCADLKARFGFPGTPEEIHARRYAIAQELLRTHVRWREGAAETLRRLKALGLTLAIATTTRRRNIEIYRDENEGMRAEAKIGELFTLVRTRDDVEKTKPDPEVHLTILRELGVAPEEALVVEDAKAGLAAARAAGIDAVVISERHSECDREENDRMAQARFENYAEVLERLEAEVRAGVSVRSGR